MQLKLDVLPYIVGYRVAIALLGTVVGEFGQIVGLELDAVNLVVATQTLYHRLALVLGQRVEAVLIGGELLVEIFLCELLMPFLLGTEALGNGEEGHDGTVVDAVEFHLI